MPLVGPKEMFARAYAESYAVGAFNINNMEIIQGIMQAASEEKSPVILQVSAGARKYAGQPYIMKLAEAALQENDLPMVIHLDHGADFEICKACIDGGFTSVMIDGSHHAFEENIAITKKVVEYAHDKGVWVEAELGQLAGVEEHVSAEKSVYTDPDQAVEFVERSGCDSLAIAIGTSHGAYKFKGKAELDFDRLEKISKHGGFILVVDNDGKIVKNTSNADINHLSYDAIISLQNGTYEINGKKYYASASKIPNKDEYGLVLLPSSIVHNTTTLTLGNEDIKDIAYFVFIRKSRGSTWILSFIREEVVWID